MDFNFTGLNESTSYMVYWAGSSENPITITEFTNVQSREVNTTGILVIKFSQNLAYSYLILFLLFIFIIFSFY